MLKTCEIFMMKYYYFFQLNTIALPYLFLMLRRNVLKKLYTFKFYLEKRHFERTPNVEAR